MTRIYLCCGSGICTSTAVRKKVEAEMDKRGYKGKYSVTQGTASDAAAQSVNFDVVVSTTMLKTKCACPIIVATGLLMNRGTDAIYSQIEEVIKGNL